MTSLLTVTTQGQETLRRELPDHLHVRPGDKLAVDILPNGKVARRAAKPANSIADFAGCLAPAAKRLSIEEIGEAAARGWGGRT